MIAAKRKLSAVWPRRAGGYFWWQRILAFDRDAQKKSVNYKFLMRERIGVWYLRDIVAKR